MNRRAKSSRKRMEARHSYWWSGRQIGNWRPVERKKTIMEMILEVFRKKV